MGHTKAIADALCQVYIVWWWIESVAGFLESIDLDHAGQHLEPRGDTKVITIRIPQGMAVPTGPSPRWCSCDRSHDPARPASQLREVGEAGETWGGHPRLLTRGTRAAFGRPPPVERARLFFALW